MTALPQELERTLAQQESNPFDAGLARRALEDAVIYQFRVLAAGLLAESILRDGCLQAGVARQHFESGDEPSETTRIREASQRFGESVASGTQGTILIRELSQVRVRILGGEVQLWDDCEINQQLSGLGSDVRLAFPGAARLSELVLRETIGQSDDKWPVDARFILGRVGAKTAGPFGPVFDFHVELAVSPYVDPSATAFTYENRAVVRRAAIRRVVLDRQMPQEAIEVQCLHNLIHELVHTSSYSHPSQQSYAAWHYTQDLKADIRRFTETAKSRAEIEQAFDLSYERDIVAFKAKALGRSLPEQKLPDSMQVVALLIQDGSVGFDGVSYLSTAYGDGRRWAF
ncbi:MAG: hypothetical protein QOC81_4011 [Thermoanaerobaculia bacterium]|jgi:hypothetical protein|nr:hypothetical protein [Thermoanaerobaculia bacterium]